MKIGVPTEVKNNEQRVGLTPESVKVLCNQGHELFIQSNAGRAIGFTNELYELSGAQIINSASDIFKQSELIIKVKEPVEDEFKFLRDDLALFAYLHLAGDPQQAKKLLKTGITGIAYETVTADDGSLPLLAPMSAIAGQLGVVVGSYHLLKPNNGRGTLLSELDPRIVTVIGAGVAGKEAIAKAKANHAQVKVIDLNHSKLEELKLEFGEEGVEYIISSPDSIKEAISKSDIVIGSVYVVGKEAPKVVSKEMLADMTEGSVLVDISIDQGGCFESSKPTNHDEPTFIENGVLHYCVTNMPGAVPLSATTALNRATLPFIKELANKGINKALNENKHLMNGLNIQNGEIIHPAIKEALGKSVKD
jgi:alanine dehydrogenase|tara:strand:- start:1553 stop:2644 length:1092 start_codon:yes stop_codon:yes gene_type:complete